LTEERMKQSHTAVVERKEEFTDQFQTHPYETAWAGEAIFFLRVEELSGQSPELSAAVQISVDGVNWVDEGTTLGPIYQEGDYFVRVSHFGGWLRLSGEVWGENAGFILTVHLVLKE
jgi:hypothetical protein